MKKLLGLTAWLVLVFSTAAHQITLTWNPSPDAAGYKIYYGQVGQSMTNVWLVGNTNIATITNLVSATNIVYRFTCVATNSAGNESLPSLELQSVIVPLPVIDPRFVALTTTGVTLTWTPSTETDAQSYKVTYGTVNPLATNSVLVAHPNTLLTITNGLMPDTEYYFDVTVINSAGVESRPYRQLRHKLLPAGPGDLKVGIIVN